jgi:hypothetical protein
MGYFPLPVSNMPSLKTARPDLPAPFNKNEAKRRKNEPSGRIFYRRPKDKNLLSSLAAGR